MLLYIFHLFAILGLATATKLGDPCRNSNNYCDDGSWCLDNICGGYLALCSNNNQCTSGTCDPSYYPTGRCTAKLKVGQAGCTFRRRDGDCESFECNDQYVCGGDGTYTGVSCDQDPNHTTCATNQCASGLQVNVVCTPQHQNRHGDSCQVSEQCPVGVSCESGICGGLGACTPSDISDTDGTGPSSQCTNGDRCILNYCRQPFGLGDPCDETYSCGISTCISGMCGGYGATCTPESFEAPDSGPTSQCFSQYCIANTCQERPQYTYCTRDDECSGGGFTCGTDGRCGGLDASCYPDRQSPDGSGISQGCNEGKSCYGGKCAVDGTIQVGGSCSSTDLCSPNLHCIQGSCSTSRPSNEGVFCTDSYGCFGGTFCYDSECSFPFAIGHGCDDSTQCANSECSNNQCGGDGATCLAEGRTTDCVSGYCDGSTCTQDPNPPCSSSNPCSSPYSCGIDGVCGGTGALCAPDDYSPDNSGYSTLCQPAKSCYNGQCQLDGALGVGDSCSATDLCQPNLHCIDGTCKDSLPANTGAYCSDDTGCTGGTICVDSECTVPSPGPSDKPVGKRDMQLAWTQARCRRSDEIACPISGDASMAYECINPLTNIESCGGCLYGRHQLGQDCTSFLNVDVVACVKGACVIESCSEGYQHIAQNHTCVSVD